MNALSAIANRKHRKNDASSDQLNAQAKCMNEKRRRELENAYISELAELISTSDMAQSSKKDKCVILQETVDQIKSIKHHQESVADAVQQGEVSSSRPAIYTNDFGPLLLEALEAFGFIVNSDYRIEYITDNVFDFIRYRGDELLGNSIFNFIHHSDHQSFSSGIVPVIQGASYGYQTDSSHKSRSVSCRILVKSGGGFDNSSASSETMDHVQQQQARVNEYENMEISILKKMKSPESLGLGGELSSGLGGQDCSDGQLLVCMARKVPDTKPLASQQLQQQTAASAVSAPSETIITRLDVCGKVLSIDTQNLAPTRAPYFTQELVGQSLLGLTCRSDQPRLASYMDRVINSSEQGPHHLDEIRIRGTMPNKYFRIQTRSRRFKNPDHNFFINAIHTITGEECMLEPVSSPRPTLLTTSPAAAATVGPATSVHQMCSSVSLPSPVVVSTAFQYRSGHQPSPADSAASSTITLNASDGFSTLTVASDAYTDNDLFSELFSDSGGGGGFSAASPQPLVNNQQYSMPPRSSVATPTPLSRPSSRQQSLPPTPTPCHPQQQQQQSSPYHYQYSPAAASAPPSADNNNGQLKGMLGVRSLSTDTKDNNLLQGLLGCVDEVDVKPPAGMVSSMNVIGNHIINNNNSTTSSKQPVSSGGGSDNMLRQLLNDRNEQRVKAKKNEELMLLLNGGPTAARTSEQLVGVSTAAIRRTSGSGSVGVPSPLLVSGDVYDGGSTGDLMSSQKRPSQDDDSDIVQQSKRSAVRYPSGGGMVLEMSGGGIVSTGQQLTLGDASQQLQQTPGLPSRNKMLAELLARSCNQSPAVPTTIAQQARPSDLPQNKLPRKEELQRKLQTHGRIAVSGPAAGMQLSFQQQQQQEDPMLLLGGSNRPQQQQHHQQLQVVNRHMAPSGNQAVRGGVGVAASAGVPGLYSGMSASSGPAAVAASNSGGDRSELDNILDDIITFEEKYQVNSGMGPRSVDVASNMNEKKAIHEIQQSLMQAENNMRGFPQVQQTAVARSAPGYPPPGYHLSRGQVGGLTSQINMVRTQMSLYPGVSQNRLTSQQVVQRQRLLQQQQQQRLLVNNQSGGSVADQLTAAAGAAFQNMDDILNTTPPNVSLQQRLSGGQQESHGSPAYSPSVIVSPQSNQMSPAPQAVSPRSPGMAAAFPGGFAATQMSPRAAGSVPSPFQPQPSPGGQQQQQQSVSQQPPVSVVQSRMAAVATGNLQQQNPELNAQLSGTFGIRGQSYQLPQRNAPMLRATGVSQHQQQQQQQQLYHHHQQQQQLLRLQRPPATAAVSLPPGQIQMSGGRHYGAEQLPKMLPPPPHSHPHGYAGYPQMSHPLQTQMMPHMDMYTAMDERLQHPAGVLSVSGHQQQAGLVGGSGSSDFVRQELRRAIVGQQRHHSMPGGVATLPTATGEPPPRPGGRSLTQEDLEELGLEVPTVPGDHTRWSNHVAAGGSMVAGLMTAGDHQQLQPPAAAPPHSTPAAINSNHPAMPSSLLRDLLMSD